MTSEDTPIYVTEALRSCRCCLRRAADKDLATPYTHLGTTEIYSDMLKECFEIHVTLDAEDECGICDVCVGRLREASTFKLQVQRSQVELKARLRGEQQARVADFLKFHVGENKWMREDSVLSEPAGNSEVSDDDSTSEPSYGKRSEARGAGHGDHTYAKTECPPAAVPIEGEDGAEAEPAGEQLAMACSVTPESLRGDEAPHASQTCLATSRRGPRLASRMTDTPDDTAGLRAEEQAYTCDTCGEHFTDKSTLIGHIQGHVGPTRDVCHKSYVNKCVLKQQKMIHTGKGPPRLGPRLASRVTDMSDDTAAQPLKSNLYEHIKTRPIDKTYADNIFKQQFTEEGDWTVQIRKHNEQIPYEFNTDTLLLAVKSSSSFRQRRPGHTPKRYSCNICKKQFKYVYYLNRHVRTHTGLKPFMCDLCGKTFADSSTLRRHKQTHASVQPYTCDVCSKKFRHKGDMVRHVRIHAGTHMRPYTCDVCSKTFANSAYLRKHQRTHSKPYICEKCGEQFTRKTRLAIHFVRH